MQETESALRQPNPRSNVNLFILIFLLVAVFVALDLVTSRRIAFEQAEELALTQVQLLAQILDNTLHEVSHLTTITVQELEREGARMGSTRARQILRSRLLYVEQVANAAVYDSEGNRIARLRSGEPVPPEHLVLEENRIVFIDAGIDYFQELDGGGALTARVESAYLRNALQMTLGSTMGAQILDADGDVLVGWGGNEKLVHAAVAEGSREPLFTLYSGRWDEHVIAVDQLRRLPLRVALVMTPDLVLGQWHSRARLQIAYSVAGMVLLSGALSIINRRNVQVWAVRTTAVAAEERLRIATALRAIERAAMQADSVGQSLEEVGHHLKSLYPLTGTWIEEETDFYGVAPFSDITGSGSAGEACRAAARERGDARIAVPVLVDDRTGVRFMVESSSILPDDAVAVIESAVGAAVRVFRTRAAELGRTEEAEQRARDREMLVRETHHRVKNNLAVIESLLSLQGARAGNEETRALIAGLQGRIASISLLHSSLYRTDNLTDLSFGAYCRDLTAQIREAYDTGVPGTCLDIEIDEVENLMLSVDTVKRVGLIVHELVANAFKHARGESPRILVRCRIDYDAGPEMELVVADNGPGLTEAGPDAASGRNGSIGLVLVNALVDELDGRMDHWNDEGAHFRIVFPVVRDVRKLRRAT